MADVEEKPDSTIGTIGSTVDHVPVSIGPRFLELFSEHLYPSPNKAFEELVSNSWDAGAQVVYVGMPTNLLDNSASVWVLDDGESMTVDGFHMLWAVATSQKRDNSSTNGRPQIGKFGIGKLATYILANELTYICKAQDGLIRAITMDYRRIDAESAGRLHIDPVRLDVRQLNRDELQELLQQFASGPEILSIIEQGVPKPKAPEEEEDEFGGKDSPPTIKNGTWTLALLTSLKTAGKSMQLGWIQRLLRSALPLGSSMSIICNGERLLSSKIDKKVTDDWVIGPGLGISSITVTRGLKEDTKAITEHASPYPHVSIEGLEGVITGRVRLYEEKISGGKSDAIASSNGFLVNILGRVINLDDPYFGLENLNHSAWAKFRATVRVDGLDEALGINREDILHGPELDVFRAFLRGLFNKARVTETARQVAMPSAGEILTKSWGVMPLQPLAHLVAQGLSGNGVLPDFIDLLGVDNKEETLREWREIAANHPGELITDIALGPMPPDAGFVKYDLAHRRVVINENHPFSRGFIENEEQQSLLRDTAFADFLTKIRMLDVGIDSSLVEEVWQYRDKILRLLTQINRRTAAQIAELLLQTTGHDKGLETAVADALESLGFSVRRLAQRGEPEGVAIAPTPPDKDDVASSYSFTYDAKSAIGGKVKAKDVNVAGLVRHRKKYKAQYILVIGPDYELGALQQECADNNVTPMRASDLASLLMLTVATGPFDLVKFKKVFLLHDPDEVHTWVEEFVKDIKASSRVSLDVFLAALANIGYKGPNAITTPVIADRISQLQGISYHPKRDEIRRLVAGLSILVPNLIQLSGDDVFVTTSPKKLREAIVAQIGNIPPKYRPEFDITETPVSV